MHTGVLTLTLKHTPLALALLFCVTACATPEKKNRSCRLVRECVELAAELTGKKYMAGKGELQGEIQNLGEVVWTGENADQLLSEVLGNADYYRVLVAETGVYYILPAKDIRFEGRLKSFAASLDSGDELPPASRADYAELVYTVKHDPKMASAIAPNLRPFISRYGRVIDIPASGAIIVRDNLQILHGLLPLIRKMDVKAPPASARPLPRGQHNLAPAVKPLPEKLPHPGNP
jgi:type II secretory pathway component GspD/PulD (secretin)